jgi:hypothetical protein
MGSEDRGGRGVWGHSPQKKRGSGGVTPRKERCWLALGVGGFDVCVRAMGGRRKGGGGHGGWVWVWPRAGGQGVAAGQSWRGPWWGFRGGGKRERAWWMASGREREREGEMARAGEGGRYGMRSPRGGMLTSLREKRGD